MPAENSACDIALIRCPDRSMGMYKKIGAVQHPMNLLSLAAWLKRDGHNAMLTDLQALDINDLREYLLKLRPLAAGISVMTPDMPEAKKICALCKELGIITIAGGVHPTIYPKETLNYTGADYVISGEGEIPLSELLRSIKNSLAPDEIRGLTFRRNGAIVSNERPALLNPESLPIPDRSLLSGDYSGYSTPGVLKPAAVLFTSRGCPYSCFFCASGIINCGKVRFRKMEDIYREIDEIASLGYSHITVEDDMFTVKKDRMLGFCGYLIKNYPRMTWDCDSRVDTIDDEMLGMMKKSGCIKIAYGVESGSQRILDSVNKKIRIDRVIETFRLTAAHKIPTQAFFMVGFPDETMEDIEMTERLIRRIRPDYLFLSVAVPYPGTELFNKTSWNKNIHDIDWGKFIFFGADIPWQTKNFTGSEIHKLRKRISRKYYFSLPYISKKILSIKSPQDLFYYIKGFLVALKAFR